MLFHGGGDMQTFAVINKFLRKRNIFTKNIAGTTLPCFSSIHNYYAIVKKGKRPYATQAQQQHDHRFAVCICFFRGRE